MRGKAAWCGGTDLAVAYRGVAPGIGSQNAAKGRATGAVHDRVAGKGAVQVLLYLQVPVPAGGVPVCPNLAQLARPTLYAQPVVNALASINKRSEL